MNCSPLEVDPQWRGCLSVSSVIPAKDLDQSGSQDESLSVTAVDPSVVDPSFKSLPVLDHKQRPSVEVDPSLLSTVRTL